jgi:hypothetical protein
MRRFLGLFVFFVACNTADSDSLTSAEVSDAPCTISMTEPTTPGQPVVATYRLLCATGTVEMSILEVSGHEGNWADVTRWGLCGHDYVEEFVHPNRLTETPWAILSTFDGNGGDISSCRTSNAPLD